MQPGLVLGTHSFRHRLFLQLHCLLCWDGLVSPTPPPCSPRLLQVDDPEEKRKWARAIVCA